MASVTAPRGTALAQTHDDLPSFYRNRSSMQFQPLQDINVFIRSELDVSRLDDMVDRGLPLAGRLGNIRPVHRQLLLGRRIIIAEQMDLHLLWKGGAIFIKPLPGWLVDEDFVRTYVTPNGKAEQVANGFLASYTRLINHKCDYHIAKDLHLLPEHMQWKDWQAFAQRLAVLLDDMAAGKKHCSPRFEFGELRLNRINMIYRFHPAYRLAHVVRGFHYENMTYQSFLRRNFAWLVVVFAYLTIILTAMQVGLGTEQLRGNRAFNNISYGFTVFALLMPLVALVIGIVVSIFLTGYHVQATRQHLKLRAMQLPPPKGGGV